MAWFIGQSIVAIVLAFALGLVVGYLVWGRRSQTADDRVATGAAAAPAPEVVGATAMPVPAASAVTADADPAHPVHIPAPRGEATVGPAPAPGEINGVAADPALVDDVGDLDAFDDDTFAAADATADPDLPPTGHDSITAELAIVEAAAAQPAIDDLARIEGIGPKFAAALVAAGIRSYDQLADADEAALRKALTDAGLRFAPSITTWARQARLLADGDEDAFAVLTARLIAGRDVGDTAPPDDLARIEGIGPRFAGALVDAGIRTFGQLADADEATLRKALTDAGLRFAPSITTWARQARLLATGDENGFAELTARLIAGRNADDELERIEGVGPAIAAALRDAGIRTYRAMANASTVKLRNALEGAGLKFAPSITTWSRQARLLADGDEEGFADLTRKLIAGRDEGRA